MPQHLAPQGQAAHEFFTLPDQYDAKRMAQGAVFQLAACVASGPCGLHRVYDALFGCGGLNTALGHSASAAFRARHGRNVHHRANPNCLLADGTNSKLFTLVVTTGFIALTV